MTQPYFLTLTQARRALDLIPDLQVRRIRPDEYEVRLREDQVEDVRKAGLRLEELA